MGPTSFETGGGGCLSRRFEDIVVLKVLDSETKFAPAGVQGGEQALVHSEVRRGNDIEWNCPVVECSSLHQNGYKLSEEMRRSGEFSASRRRSSRDFSHCTADKEEKENFAVRFAPGDLVAGNKAKDATDMSDQGGDMDMNSEKAGLDENGLRDRVWALEEEKGKLHKNLAAVTLKETILREKVREFELQMDGHRKRVDRAEKTILELRQAAAQSNKQARQADVEVEELRSMCTRKDGEKQDLQNRVDRLQQLCMDHEKSIHGLRQGLKNGMDGNKEGRMSRLQKEMQRLSGVEVTLRTELEASRVENATLRRDINGLLERFANQQGESAMQMEKLDEEMREEIDRGQARVAELQDENTLLFAKLRLVTRERQDIREALKTCNDKVSGLEDENRCLQDKVANAQRALEDRQTDIHRLETQLECLIKDKRIVQAALALKETVAANAGMVVKAKDRETRDSPNLGSEMRQSLQAASQQLYSMIERLETLMDKLSERDLQLQEARAEIAGKDEVVNGLEQTLSNLAKAVDSQSSRMMRLSKQNEDLTILTQAQAKQIEDFKSRTATLTDSNNSLEQELDSVKKRLNEFEKHYESQDLTCHLLRERAEALEVDLQHCQSQVSHLLQQRNDLTLERGNLHQSLTEASSRITDLEHRLADKEEAINSQEVALEELRKQADDAQKELNRVKQERDEMQMEAEAMSREALRTSMEVEVLRRRVHQLDEDVLLRDGQICILRGSLEDT